VLTNETQKQIAVESRRTRPQGFHVVLLSLASKGNSC